MFLCHFFDCRELQCLCCSYDVSPTRPLWASQGLCIKVLPSGSYRRRCQCHRIWWWESRNKNDDHYYTDAVRQHPISEQEKKLRGSRVATSCWLTTGTESRNEGILSSVGISSSCTDRSMGFTFTQMRVHHQVYRQSLWPALVFCTQSAFVQDLLGPMIGNSGAAVMTVFTIGDGCGSG